MTDPSTGNPAQAAIAQIDETAVFLVNRMGRRISMPRRSFNLSWHFVFNAPEQRCAHGDCDMPGYLQMQQLGRWVWVCIHHLPPGTNPLLPCDRPGTQTQVALEQCPGCRAPTNLPGSGSASRAGTVHTIHRCGACNRQWVLLIGQGSASDGLWYGGAIQEAAAALEEGDLSVRCLMGSVAFQSLERAAGRLGDPPSIGGVPLILNESHGSNNAVVLGERPSTGIQRMGGQPDQATPPPPSVLPTVGSLWRFKGSPAPVYEVSRVDYAMSRTDTVPSPGDIHVTVQEIVEGSVDLETLQPPRYRAYDLPTFLNLCEPVHSSPSVALAELIGTLSSHRGQLPESVSIPILPSLPGDPNVLFSALIPPGTVYSDSEPQYIGSNPIRPGKPLVPKELEPTFPRVGDTWWAKATLAPVTIVETGVTNGNVPYVKIKEGTSPSPTTLSVTAFYERHIQSPTEPTCKVGDEFIGADNKVIQIVKVDPLRVTVRHQEDGRTTSLTEATLRLNYKRLVRKSAYDIIGGDDEQF
jgi:hypothetical protein